MVLLLPVFPVLHFMNIETFEWPNKSAIVGMTFNAIIGTVISDFCWAKSVVLLGPLITTLGITLTIPISMIVDNFYEDRSFSKEFIIGSVLILLSFFVMTYLDFIESKKEEEEKQTKKCPEQHPISQNTTTESARWLSICLYGKKKNQKNGSYTRV